MTMLINEVENKIYLSWNNALYKVLKLIKMQIGIPLSNNHKMINILIVKPWIVHEYCQDHWMTENTNDMQLGY